MAGKSFVNTIMATVNGAIIVEPGVGIDDKKTVPEFFELMGNYPNPFNAQTMIEFSISRPGYAVLEIFDIQGRRIRVLHNGHISAGNHSVIWNGRSDSGTEVASGIYLYRLSHENEAITRKMNLVK